MIRVRAFAPATVGNAGVGFDLLGFALDVCGDVVEVSAGNPGVRILSISGAQNLPLDAGENTATAGLVKLIGDRRIPFGFDVRIDKGIPIGSGLGGSASSAVAGIVAASALLDEPLTKEEMLKYALIGEAIATGAEGGAHADNVVPCLLGGLQICDSDAPMSIPVPDGVRVVVVHPDLTIKTSDSRKQLPDNVPLATVVNQTRFLSTFIASGFSNDAERFGKACVDLLAEPGRRELIPGFEIAKQRALLAGAWSFSISGSGPTVFALVPEEIEKHVEELIVSVFTSQGITCQSWCTSISKQGARIENYG